MQAAKKRSFLLLSLLLTFTVSSLSLVPLFAQGNNTVITIAIEEFQQNFFTDDAFEAFEEAHLGVDVVTVILSNEDRYFGSPQEVDEVEEFLANTSNLAAQADLLPLDYFNEPRLRTRAGMYLDINPLLNADPDANVEDFYSAMLESLQWDGGTWGLPMSGSVQLVTYDKNKFDEAGLAYPDTSWTLDDFINAGMALTEFDSEGNVTIPGFFGFDPSMLFASLLDGDLSDPNTFPSRPLLNTPENIEMVEKWADYLADYEPDFSRGMNFDFNAIPLSFNGTYALNDEFNFGSSDADTQGAFLPGNQAGLQVQTYAISAGTSNPQLAYDLLQYMSSTPEIAYAFFGDVPARQSLQNSEVDDSVIFRPDVPEDLQVIIDDALANAIPMRDLHFATYLGFAASQVNSDENPVDAETALQEYQENLTEIFIEIENFATTNIVEVATPVPTPVLQSGEVSLTFGLETFMGPGADRSLWQLAIDDFVAQDSQVGQITLNTEFVDMSERIETQDCFYLSSNPVQTFDLSQFFSIDPFLSTDMNLNPANFVNGTLNQVSRDNATWAMPLSLTANVIWYDPQAFADAGLPEPTNDWTIFEFADAMRALTATSGEAAFHTESFLGTYIHQLITAYGGIPVDFSTNPYTIDLENPTNIEAIRQVLQLAQDGLIDYRALSNFGGGGGFGGRSGAMFDANLLTDDFGISNRGTEGDNGRRVVMFPRGIDYLPVSYSLGTALISSNTPAPDACYRWLSFLSRRGELLSGMPAQVDMFENAVADIGRADDIVALYTALNEALQSPNVVVIASPFVNSGDDPVAGITNFISQNWVNTAFDNVVLEDADLNTALADANQFISEFASCTEGIAPLDRPTSQLSDDEQGDYFGEFIRCAIAIDPSLEEVFGFALEDDE